MKRFPRKKRNYSRGKKNRLIYINLMTFIHNFLSRKLIKILIVYILTLDSICILVVGDLKENTGNNVLGDDLEAGGELGSLLNMYVSGFKVIS